MSHCWRHKTDPSRLSSFFFLPLHLLREEDVFDLQGYSGEKKAPLWQKSQFLEVSYQLTDGVCGMGVGR